MGSSAKTIVWFRRDLRIEDNPALAAGARDGCVIPVFIWCPEEEKQFFPGRVSRWWLKQSLAHLDQSLSCLGSPLIFIKAESTIAALLQCIEATKATRVVFNRLYDPVSLVRDRSVQTHLSDKAINVQTFNGDLLYEPWEIHDGNGHAFTFFDSFWEKCMSLPIETTSALSPWKLIPPAETEGIAKCSIEDLGLELEMEKPSNALLGRAWSPGWSNAEKTLVEFINCNLLDYSNDRIKLDDVKTSLLSPFLHFGEISVRKVYQSVRMKHFQWVKEGIPEAAESVKYFLRSIGLREYSRYLCFNFPFTYERSLLGNLRHYPWRYDEAQFKAWRQGRTGYPLVDAGMRELWATGWIHNRTRVIVSSFFVKYLILPWTWGMKYFWDTLLDADLESDILGWQYVSGSLPDGHELDRFDTPEVQGSRFDPRGEYVRLWLPELARVPIEWIHHPWDAPKAVLAAAGVELGLNYPKPIVEITSAKERLNDVVAMLWELDRAAKADDADEVVADNLVGIHNLDIPKVVVKRDAPSVASSHDQRVPSFQCLSDSSAQPKRLTGIDCEMSKQNYLMDFFQKTETSTINEDLRSTAESSSRKRSSSESQYAVPMPSLSPSSSYCYKSSGTRASSGAPSVYPNLEEQKAHKIEEEEENDDFSTIDSYRPYKKLGTTLSISKRTWRQSWSCQKRSIP